MKRIIAVLLSCVMVVTGCGGSAGGSGSEPNNTNTKETVTETEESHTEEETIEETVETVAEEPTETEQVVVEQISEEPEIDSEAEQDIEEAEKEYLSSKRYSGLNDPKLLQQVEDKVYSELVSEFDSEDYIIENVKAVYISKEYLEELDYNSKANLFFGYTLAELDEQFQGTRYVFTLGDNGETIVKPFEKYDDTYVKALKNVAIGTGVILICVTVSVATGGAGLAPVSMVFAASAKTATTMALSSGAIGGLSAGIVEGVRTKDFDKALKAAARQGSEAFKWGAISGAITGGATELSAIRRTANAVDDAVEYSKGAVEIADDLPKWRQAELRALNDSGGYEQLTFFKGKRVPMSTKGATRPDVVRSFTDHIEAVEVKYYDLNDPSCLNMLYRELQREIKDRVLHLPPNSTQRIILDVTDRGIPYATCVRVIDNIHKVLSKIYPNIPIEIVGAI